MFEWHSISTSLTVMMVGLIVGGVVCLGVLTLINRLPGSSVSYVSGRLKHRALILSFFFPLGFWYYQDSLLGFATGFDWTSLLLGALGVLLFGVALFLGVLGLMVNDEETE